MKKFRIFIASVFSLLIIFSHEIAKSQPSATIEMHRKIPAPMTKQQIRQKLKGTNHPLHVVVYNTSNTVVYVSGNGAGGLCGESIEDFQKFLPYSQATIPGSSEQLDPQKSLKFDYIAADVNGNILKGGAVGAAITSIYGNGSVVYCEIWMPANIIGDGTNYSYLHYANLEYAYTLNDKISGPSPVGCSIVTMTDDTVQIVIADIPLNWYADKNSVQKKGTMGKLP